MRKYWQHYRLMIQTTLAYRGSLIVFRLSGLLLLVTLISVWMASRSNGSIGGYTIDGLISYYLFGFFLNSVVFWWSSGTIKEEIRDGTINTKALSKPISYYWQKLFEEFGWHTVSPIFAIVIISVAAFFLQAHIQLSLTPASFILLFFSIAFAAVTFFNISSCLGLLTFWFTETAGISTFIWAGTFLFGGQAIPISFFSGTWRTIIQLLPFRYVYSFPNEIFTRNLTTEGLLIGFSLQIFWLLATGLAYKFLWQKGIKRYSAFGG